MVAVLGLLLALVLAGPVSAQVDCSDPDNLCTGDPCVIPALEVGPNCVVDFGTRTVTVAGNLRVTDVLDLSASYLTVEGRILGGDTVRLTASNLLTIRAAIKATGPIELESGLSGLSVLGRLRGGPITLHSAGSLSINKPVRAFQGGILAEAEDVIATQAPLVASSTSGCSDVTLDAGLGVSVERSIYVDCRYPFGSGGTITIRGDGGVYVAPGVAFLARHSQLAGYVVVESSAGDVFFDARVLASAAQDGGGLEIDGQNATVHVAMVASGGYLGGSADIQAAGDLVLTGIINVKSDDDPGGGGTIRAVAGGDLTVTGRYQAAPNGDICLSAGGTLDTSGATFDGPVTTCPP